MDEERLRRLAGALRDPGEAGTRPNDMPVDLGVAMIELFARTLDRVSAYARHAADESRLESAAQASRLALPSARRPRFFAGQVLRAEDLQAAQDHLRERQRLLLLLAVGSGVASGLTVTCADAPTGARVTVAPGMAIDPVGELLVLRDEARVPVALQVPGFVCLRYLERPCDPTPSVADGALEPTRVEDAARVTVEAEVPADGVALARLVRCERAIAVDPTFRPRRVGRAMR